MSLSPLRLGLFTSAVLFAMLRTPVALAADTAPPTADNDDALSTIMVTANKRSENIKDVPTSISVLGGVDLNDHHVINYDDLTRSVPGISFGAGGSGDGAGEGLSNIEIRGVSSNSGSAVVAIYMDDTSLTVKNTYDGAAQPYLIDIDHVEVLRGPQGSLYGASSMGGTIKFISKQPNMEEYSADLATDISGTKHGSVNYDEQAVINVPVLPDVFAFRTAIAYGDDSGWIDNYQLVANADGTSSPGGLNKTGVNDVRHLVVRTIGKIVLDTDFTITPEILFQRFKSADSPVFYPAPVVGLWEQDKEVTESQRDTLFVPSVTVNKGMSFADLTSVTSYFWRQTSRVNDGTYYNSNIFGQYYLNQAFPNATPAEQAGNNTVIAYLPSPVYFHTTYGQASEELRLASKPPEQTGVPIRWVAGLYYADQWNTHRDNEPILGLDAAFQRIYGVPISQTNNSFLGTDVNPGLYNNDIIYFSSSRYDERQYAPFGQADFDLLPDLHGSIGLRYIYARSAYTRYGGGFYDLGNISPYVQVARYYSVNPKYSVTYDLDSTSSIYASAAKGFRLGGPTGPTPTGPGGNAQIDNPCAPDYVTFNIKTAPTKFDSDKLWSYEFGTKSSILERTLSINAAVYYIDWQNIQQTINLPTCGFGFTSNVGNAESYGGELEMHYKVPVVKGLTLGLTAGVTHATITSTTNSAVASVGQKVPFTPDWTATVSADYNWPITDDYEGYIRADYDWTGRSRGSYQQTINGAPNPDYSRPQYDVLNVSAGVIYGQYDVSLYVKNATNDQTIIQRPLINSVITGYTVQPMTIGMHAVAHF